MKREDWWEKALADGIMGLAVAVVVVVGLVRAPGCAASISQAAKEDRVYRSAVKRCSPVLTSRAYSYRRDGVSRTLVGAYARRGIARRARPTPGCIDRELGRIRGTAILLPPGCDFAEGASSGGFDCSAARASTVPSRE